MTRDYIESCCVSHYHVIATIEIRKGSVEFFVKMIFGLTEADVAMPLSRSRLTNF
jgi:hypothetical protein